jgi:hypothetical protein
MPLIYSTVECAWLVKFRSKKNNPNGFASSKNKWSRVRVVGQFRHAASPWTRCALALAEGEADLPLRPRGLQPTQSRDLR